MPYVVNVCENKGDIWDLANVEYVEDSASAASRSGSNDQVVTRPRRLG